MNNSLKHRIRLVAVSASFVCCPGLASAQPFANKNPLPPTKTSPVVLSMRFKEIELKTLFKLIENQANIKIILSDDVRGKIKSVLIFDATPEVALERIAKSANLALGKVGEETYLIVRSQRPTKPEMDSARQEKTKPKGTPFQFNGETFYFLPIARK